MLKDIHQLVEMTLGCVLMAKIFMCLEDLFQAFDIMIYTATLLQRIDGNAFSQTTLIMNLKNLKIFLFLDLDWHLELTELQLSYSEVEMTLMTC